MPNLYLTLRSLRSWPASHKLALAAIAVVIVIGGVLRVQAIGGDKHVSADEAGYAADANRILGGEPYSSFKWAPGTPFVFALATRLSGHRSLKIEKHAHGPAQDAQLAMELATLILIAITAWLLAGPWAALIAVVLGATYIPLIFLTRTYLAESLGGLMFVTVMLAGLLTHRRLSRGSVRSQVDADAKTDASATALSAVPARRVVTLDLLALAATGVVSGLTVLSRNDLALGMVAIAVALALTGRPSRRVLLVRLIVFGGCALLTVAPWVIYASEKQGRFVPITTSGPDALFMGTYLPGGGEQFPVVKAFEKPVCARLAQYCHPYRAGFAAPMFALIQKRHPGLSEPEAAEAETFHNLRIYALGRPLSFLKMLASKFWNMWRLPWSGGNSGLHPDTNHPQHSIYAALAWFGLLWGVFRLRRWPFTVALLALLIVSVMNVLFVADARDNLRMMPLLFAYGAPGLYLAVRERLLPALKGALGRRSSAPSAAG
jgi:hypothetical protein